MYLVSIDNVFAYGFLLAAIPFAICIIVGIIAYIISQAHLKEIVNELNLIENARYEIIVNNGRKYSNLTYNRIGYGNRSQNGKVNIYFTTTTKYRGEYINKEVMIKYGNIWKITKL